MAYPSQPPEHSSAILSSHPLAQYQLRQPSLSSPSLIPSPVVSHRSSASLRNTFSCAGCGKSCSLPCFNVGKRSRAVCRECWRWMWSLKICWACGEVVFRKTDAVGFGWCWWHWSCLSCLVCSVSALLCKHLRLDRLVSPTPSQLFRFHRPATREGYRAYRAPDL
jgi:hypothetical protein